ncbi:MAG: tetratricopeptide repeat protein, partial [Bacteroidia bacterium]
MLASLVLLTLFAFWPVGKADFITYDDPDYVTGNVLIKNLKSDNITFYFTHKTTDLFVPMVFLSFGIDNALFGIDPRGFHLMNLFWHLLNVLLVFFLVKSMSKKLFYPFLITALFALHPLHVESVAWVTERKDLLYSFFYLLAFFAWHRYRQKNKSSFLFVSLICFILSCFSKPMAITFPAMIILYDHFYGKLPLLKNSLYYLPFAMVSLIFLYISLRFMDTSHRGSFHAGYTGFDKFLVPFYGLNFYLFKILAPFNLSVVYPYAAKSGKLLPFAYLISPVITGSLCWLVFFSRRSSPLIKAGFLVFVLSMLPVLQIIPNNYTVAADRYVYLPCLGLFLALACMLNRIMENKRVSPGGLKAGLLAIILLYAFAVHARSQVWQNSISLFSDVIEKHEDAAIAYHNRGIAYNHLGNYGAAIPDLKKATELEPESFDAWSNYGWSLGAAGRTSEAISALERSVALKPDLLKGHNDLGNLYGMSGQFDLALKHLLTADSLSPGNPACSNNIAFTYQ